MKKTVITITTMCAVLSVCAGFAFAKTEAFSLRGGAAAFGVSFNEESYDNVETYITNTQQTQQSEQPVVFTNKFSDKDLKELGSMVNKNKDGFIEVWQLLMEVMGFTVPYSSWSDPKLGMRALILEKNYVKKYSNEVSPMIDNLRFIYTEAVRIGGDDFGREVARFATTHGDQNFVNKANDKAAMQALFNTPERKAQFNTIVAFRKNLPKYARFLFNVASKDVPEQTSMAAPVTAHNVNTTQRSQVQGQTVQTVQPVQQQPVKAQSTQWNKEKHLANPAAAYNENLNPAFVDFQAMIKQLAFTGSYEQWARSGNQEALENHTYVKQHPEVLEMVRDLRFLYTESAGIDESFAMQVARFAILPDDDFTAKISEPATLNLFNTDKRKNIYNRMVGFRKHRLSQYMWYVINL